MANLKELPDTEPTKSTFTLDFLRRRLSAAISLKDVRFRNQAELEINHCLANEVAELKEEVAKLKALSARKVGSYAQEIARAEEPSNTCGDFTRGCIFKRENNVCDHIFKSARCAYIRDGFKATCKRLTSTCPQRKGADCLSRTGFNACE